MIKSALNPSIFEIRSLCALLSHHAKLVTSQIYLIVVDEHVNKQAKENDEG